MVDVPVVNSYKLEKYGTHYGPRHLYVKLWVWSVSRLVNQPRMALIVGGRK